MRHGDAHHDPQTPFSQTLHGALLIGIVAPVVSGIFLWYFTGPHGWLGRYGAESPKRGRANTPNPAYSQAPPDVRIRGGLGPTTSPQETLDPQHRPEPPHVPINTPATPFPELPSTLEQLITTARTEAANGRYEESLGSLQAAEALDPNNQSIKDLIRVYRQEQEGRRQRQQANELMARASSLLRQGDVEGAAQAAQEARGIYPELPDTDHVQDKIRVELSQRSLAFYGVEVIEGDVPASATLRARSAGRWRPATREEIELIQILNVSRGVYYVRTVRPGSKAALAGLAVGDAILAVNRQPAVTSRGYVDASDAWRARQGLPRKKANPLEKYGQSALVAVIRDGWLQQLEIQ